MAFLWKVRAWFHHWMGKVLALAIIAGIGFGLWLVREPIFSVLGLIGLEMPGN